MFYTYILKEIGKKHFYVGSTNNLKNRITEHKQGKNISTRGREWKIYCYFVFNKEKIARNFETYLKTGSGRAFAKKHFEFKIDEA
jgi:putative endonuclease